MAFSARGVGSLDVRGHLDDGATAATVAIGVDIRMRQQVGGEWRIANPLPGSFINEDYFTATTTRSRCTSSIPRSRS